MRVILKGAFNTHSKSKVIDLLSVLFGHPGGNPNSLHAALAHFEAGQLEGFCMPWMPSSGSLQLLRALPGLAPMADRLARRRFQPLAHAPLVQGRLGEWRRLALRAMGRGDEGLSYEANDWLMRTMARECSRASVTAVHAYEDCSLWQFKEAKCLGKACIYDMPIGYYPAWEETQRVLSQRYSDWLPAGGLPSNRFVRPEQKRKEMALADLVLVPGSFVESTIRRFFPDKRICRAPYAADLEFWHPPIEAKRTPRLRFIYAGQASLRKGIPLLLDAWSAAALPDAELELVGVWLLAEGRQVALPKGVSHRAACSAMELRSRFQEADVFVFPSYFEGFGLVLAEAMACGLPVIASMATAGPDLVTPDCGKVIPTGDLDALVAALRWFSEHRDDLMQMRKAARAVAERCTWANYRRCVTDAVAPFV